MHSEIHKPDAHEVCYARRGVYYLWWPMRFATHGEGFIDLLPVVAKPDARSSEMLSHDLSCASTYTCTCGLYIFSYMYVNINTIYVHISSIVAG